MNNNRQNGFTLIELMVAVALVAILASMGMSNLADYIKQYKFDSYASNIEYLVKYAKMYAMERTVNIEICVNTGAKQVSLISAGTTRTSPQCTGAPIRTVGITESYISMSGSSVSIDPRGIAIFPGAGSNVCIAYNGSYSKTVISKTGTRIENGSGGCP